jgi:tetratricopeptide (TPR) repeat protein
VLSIRLIYETVVGSVDAARTNGSELVNLERETGSVRGLARALRFSTHADRLLGNYDSALAKVHEALDISERHHLVGESASAADIIAEIQLDREDLAAASIALTRAETLALRVGARYALSSLAFNAARYALLAGDPDRAARCIEPYSAHHRFDPIARQRMLYLSILARVNVARGNRQKLSELATPLRDALDLRRSTAPHDFHVASYALLIDALGDREGAIAYVNDFITRSRRDLTRPSRALQAIVGGPTQSSQAI